MTRKRRIIDEIKLLEVSAVGIPAYADAVAHKNYFIKSIAFDDNESEVIEMVDEVKEIKVEEKPAETKVEETKIEVKEEPIVKQVEPKLEQKETPVEAVSKALQVDVPISPLVEKPVEKMSTYEVLVKRARTGGRF